MQRNLELRTALVIAATSDPTRDAFPTQVQQDMEGVRKAIEETDLESWVDQAAAYQSTSSLE